MFGVSQQNYSNLGPFYNIKLHKISITAYVDTQKYVILIFGWYILLCIIIMYPKAAVATVFEIATFPLAKILHSGSIKNGFFSFWNFFFFQKKISKKTPKMIIFCVFRHNLSPNWHINMILVSTNMFSDMGNRMGAISKPPDNRVARLRIAGLPNLRISQ